MPKKLGFGGRDSWGVNLDEAISRLFSPIVENLPSPHPKTLVATLLRGFLPKRQMSRMPRTKEQERHHRK